LHPADVELFAAASGDVNPLHISPEYARATPFGAPITHGMLAALALLDRLDIGDGAGVADLTVDFRTPLRPGVEYPLRTVDAGGAVRRVQVRDGERVCTALSVRPGAAPGDEPAPASASARPAAATWRREELREGLTVEGSYGPPPEPLARLCERFPTVARRLGPLRLSCLLWSSYLAGMELPGQVALLCRVRLRFCGGPVAAGSGPLRYSARVARVDPELGMLTVRGKLSLDGVPVAEADIDALTLWPVDGPDPDRLAAALPPSSALSGRTAVVVGGSRGLGAALALALATQGCAVLVGHRGGSERVAVLAGHAARTGGTIRSVPGDAGDPRWGARVAAELRPGGLDLLVCSAAPPPRTLALEPGTLAPFVAFVSETLRPVAAPLAALLPLVRSAEGCALAVSTSAVETGPAAWPHYVTAKSAVEGLWGWAATQYPQVRFLLTRPGMLLTDQMNTPMTRDEAGAVEPVAAALVRDLLRAAPSPGTVRLLRP
jgi:NAD(P)-dependent dehydrogenase (short-subunit alcohol dehydrogenase family)